jgi:hypothetical protein
MSFTSLECDRLSVALSLTAARERGGVLERELHAALESGLAPALAGYASGRDDGSRVFIDCLVIEGEVGGAWELDILVRNLAHRIAAAIVGEIDGGGGLRFRDRADFVAAFLLALADGNAWQRWQFEEFEGLHMLSTSNAVRSVVLAEEQGPAALGRLTEGGAACVIGALNAADATRIVAGLRARGSQGHGWVPQLWRLSRELGAGIDCAPLRWLAALVASERAIAGSASDATVRLLESMLWLRDIAASGGFLGMLDPQRPRDALAALALHAGVTLDWCESASDEELRDIVAELASTGPAECAGGRHWTEHGGALLLAHRLTKLGWCERWRGLLDDADARCLALALCAQALAPAQADSVVHDAALLLAFDTREVRARLRRRHHAFRRALAAVGVDSPRASLRRRGPLVGGALGAALTSAADELLQSFAATLPGLAGSTPDYLRANLLALAAAVEAQRDGSIHASLGRAPLDVLLVLAGCKRGKCLLPGGRAVVLQEFP